MATEEAIDGIEKIALISDSLFTTFLVNTYFKIKQPKVPTKIFNNKEEALRWLKSY